MRQTSSDSTPLPTAFLDDLRKQEADYCQFEDPIRQSGFGGEPQRWRAEREPILAAVDGDGEFLDVGCANGFLLECLVVWAAERGYRLQPHGVDYGQRLIALARRRLPQFANNFHVANAWDWNPPQRYRFTYTLWDCVPGKLLADYCRRLLERAVAPNGRLIVGMYGSRSRGIPPIDLAARLRSFGFAVEGAAYGGNPPITVFAWIIA
jgi:SAM-dependent methyltransferase